ncbi:hypothetical protein IscW_ISCW000665 [Ixodes scapularis]|uniref:Uncharacterized protein n=1 Tax=Ixodes scapularis TaxID=6945 RepID=B7P611_IXOSC|nr:hypothetical protein IscW_ISCW000665 [Ixodes scapularis]|eukprot:XP_002408190.1 hypothetical protein IscW_ISCW000665 [Ixodes scapularis]
MEKHPVHHERAPRCAILHRSLHDRPRGRCDCYRQLWVQLSAVSKILTSITVP